jgi:putative nucleotide binding protein
MSEEASGSVTAIVLDYLPHGRADDDRPQYEKPTLAHVVGTDHFRLFELVIDDDAEIGIDDELVVEPADARDERIESVRKIEYDELSSGASSELEYVIEEFVADNEGRFVDFYNGAEPITLRLHTLNLLPGIGKKLRNTILDERERRPFESFEALEARVSGLHDPAAVLAERILEELREEDLKYRLFATREDGD